MEALESSSTQGLEQSYQQFRVVRAVNAICHLAKNSLVDFLPIPDPKGHGLLLTVKTAFILH